MLTSDNRASRLIGSNGACHDLAESAVPTFSRFGLPLTLRTDNGPQFISNEFKQYLKEHGIKHYTSIPLWPQSNGETKRQNCSLIKAIRVAHLDKKDWRREMNKFLTAYRSTPQSTTGASPSYVRSRNENQATRAYTRFAVAV